MSTDSGIDLRTYREADWPAVRALIQTYWAQRHPMTKKALFDWQLRGFSQARESIKSLVAVREGEVVGFRGLIPGCYQVPLDRGEMTLLPGGSSCMWTLHQDLRGQGVGLAMELKAQEMMPLMCGVQATAATSMRIYKKSGFSVLEAFHRYVAPLQAEGYARLLTLPADAAEVRAWAREADQGAQPVAPEPPDLEALAALWREATLPLRIFSLHRDREFYQWRYLDSTGFKYLFFGDGREGGLVVARLETIYAPERPELQGHKVLRLIEIVPASAQTWRGGSHPADLALLRGVCAWARGQGCLAADFYHSTGRLGALLAGAGFREQNPRDPSPLTSLCLLFQPLTYKVAPANTFFRISPPGRGLLALDFEDTCIFKSECDLDRPVLYDYERWA